MTLMMMAMMISIWMAIMTMIDMTEISDYADGVDDAMDEVRKKIGKADKVLRKGDHYGRTLFYNSRL